MSRLYLTFNTNIPDNNELATVMIDDIVLETPTGETFTIIYEEGDYGVKDGLYDARYKNLRYEMTDGEGNPIITPYDNLTPETAKLLAEAKPVELAVWYQEDGSFNLPNSPIECTDVSVAIFDRVDGEEKEFRLSSDTVAVVTEN